MDDILFGVQKKRPKLSIVSLNLSLNLRNILKVQKLKPAFRQRNFSHAASLWSKLLIATRLVQNSMLGKVQKVCQCNEQMKADSFLIKFCGKPLLIEESEKATRGAPILEALL